METMISILNLRNFHAGLPAVVLGGGPSLPVDLARLPRSIMVKFCVNQHGLQFVQPDYLVFLDNPDLNPALQAAAQGRQLMTISRLKDWSDVDLTGADWWQVGFSSHLATWLACWMGCDPVLLAGMDCYQGPRSADADPRDNAYNTPLAEHLAGWRQAFEKCQHPERIKAISGPLVEIFGKY
jgi:hypothetical protein